MTGLSEPSLGKHLQNEREQRGVTLEQVSSGTKISVRILELIESDRYADLPAKPFVRGFVASYARFLGLDPRDLMTQFGGFLEERVQERATRDSGHLGYAFERKETQGRTFLWVALSSFGLVGAVVILVLKPAIKHRRAAHVEALRETAAPIAAPASHPSTNPAIPPAASSAASTPTSTVAVGGSVSSSSAVPASTPPASTVPAVASAVGVSTPLSSQADDPMQKGDNLPTESIRHKVTLKAAEDVFVRYQTDERQVMSFKLRKGLVLVLKASDRARLEVSNPNSIAIRYRDRVYRTVGAFARDPASAAAVVRRASRPGVTLVFGGPPGGGEVGEVFGAEKPLPKTPDPQPESPAPVATPAPDAAAQ